MTCADLRLCHALKLMSAYTQTKHRSTCEARPHAKPLYNILPHSQAINDHLQSIASNHLCMVNFLGNFKKLSPCPWAVRTHQVQHVCVDASVWKRFSMKPVAQSVLDSPFHIGTHVIGNNRSPNCVCFKTFLLLSMGSLGFQICQCCCYFPWG